MTQSYGTWSRMLGFFAICFVIRFAGQRPHLIEGCPEPIEQLMTQCWHKVPAERPSMAKVTI